MDELYEVEGDTEWEPEGWRDENGVVGSLIKLRVAVVKKLAVRGELPRHGEVAELIAAGFPPVAS
ncbi:hypothetical protein KS4_28830 [Poriferisphaera corsica]|uniref:Uncharacterized protein n=1 Tax=Poriferisphaera corsica TaxID=2528020 RepID=A0A517YX65_9BACT|nr:hypothetical protein KS4_28830 [Poriferisphaera corsica]